MAGYGNTVSGEEPLDIGEDIYSGGPAPRGGGITREVPKAAVKLGFHESYDPRLVRYDRVEARSKPALGWDVMKADRMSKEEAGNMMVSLLSIYGLQRELSTVHEAFHRAVYYSLTINGASVLQPGRGTFTIAGTDFELSKLVEHLGPDIRRFSRAYADEIRDNNKRILAADNPADRVAMEQKEMLWQTARKRGIQRYPDLAHDSADACSHLTDAENSALVMSKATIFAAASNMADRNRARPMQSVSSEAGSMVATPTALADALADNK